MPRKKDYWKNPAKFRADTNRYRLEHPEWKRRTNREWMRQKLAKLGPAYAAGIQLRRKRKDPIGYLLQHAQTRAELKGLPFSIAREDLVMPEVCPVFGTAWEWGVGVKGWRNMRAPSLDRINPALGYVPGNVMIISNRANHLKSNGSLNELRAVVAYMERVGAPEEREETPYTPWWAQELAEPSPQLDLFE